MKPTSLVRKFIRSAGEFLFISRDRWLTDLYFAIALPPEMEVKADALEDSCWYSGRAPEYLAKYFESTYTNFSPLNAVSKPFKLPFSWTRLPPRLFLRKCQSRDGRAIAVNDLYYRLAKDLWPNAEFLVADYAGAVTEPPNLIIRNETGALIGLMMARVLDNESPEIVKKWDSLAVHPITEGE